jgi:indolepyruvate decarboxylase
MSQVPALPHKLAVASSIPAPAVSGLSIGEYLIRRLQDYGVRDVFGLPGDYILGFYSMLEESPINVVGCTREDCAGYAADAYARINGMGVVCVTYCVGGLSLCNSIAGAYAEKSPVVVISGAPGMSERTNNPLLHHKVRDFRTQVEVFEKICVACAELTDPTTAYREIDRVLDAAARTKRPAFIELPRDLVDVVPQTPYYFDSPQPASDPDALAEAVAEAAAWIDRCKRVAAIVGVEVHRFGLQDDVLALVESSNIPFAATLLGKSSIGEAHPLYVGLYEGAMGREEVTQFVEESDCVLLLGTFMTDLNLGIFTANLDPADCIYATSEQLRIRHHHFHDVQLPDFIRALTVARPRPPARPLPIKPERSEAPFTVQPEAPITIARLMARLNELLDDDTAVIADVGDALFAATELVGKKQTAFISPAYYTSMGFAVPAALGVHVALPRERVVAIVGDGAFQMTCNELGTIVRRGFATIVIVLDNKGYGTERVLRSGKFNDIYAWRYHKLPEVFAGGVGYEVRTEGEFDAALRAAWANEREMSLIHVHIGPDDFSNALRRLARRWTERH